MLIVTFYFLNEKDFFRLLRIHVLAQIIADRPSPGSTTMDDVLNSLLGLQHGTAVNKSRHHCLQGTGDGNSGGRDLRQRPYTASGIADV